MRIDPGRLALASLGLGLLAGLVLSRLPPPAASADSLEWLKLSRPVPAFVLQTDAGELTHADLLGRWTLLLFGYSSCPDFCPTSLADLAKLRADLPAEMLTVWFISVDPRDQPEQLGEYARFFHPTFIGATGEQSDLQKLSAALGTRFRVADDQISHTRVLSLIGPDGLLHARLRSPFNAASVTASFHAKSG